MLPRKHSQARHREVKSFLLAPKLLEESDGREEEEEGGGGRRENGKKEAEEEKDRNWRRDKEEMEAKWRQRVIGAEEEDKREEDEEREKEEEEGKDEEEAQEEEDQKMPAWKKYARIVLPHVGLILLSFCYIVGGAFVFYQLERPNEIAVRRETLDIIEREKREMLEQIWTLLNDSTVRPGHVESVATERVENITKLMFEAFDTHYVGLAHLRGEKGVDQSSWSMTTAMFFTSTLLTTIGYGNLVPVTSAGRIFCIFYALFGVPLILITVADIGKFFSTLIVLLYTNYTRAKLRLSKRLMDGNSEDGAGHSTIMRAHLHELGLYNISIPVTLIAAILLGYMSIGAVLLAKWEQWALFDGFYYSFITMTTVGFGDIVPAKHEFFLFDLFYIIVGLAITTMCIDLVGIEYIEKIHYFGRAISGARFALVNVGGKMVRVPDLVRCAHVLHQKYGQKKPTKHQHKTKTSTSSTHHHRYFMAWKGAYAPKDLPYIRFIDFGSLASFESISSLFSAIFSSNNQKAREPSFV